MTGTEIMSFDVIQLQAQIRIRDISKRYTHSHSYS